MITRHFKKLLFKMALVILPIMSAQGVTITYDLNGGELSNGANSYQADSNNNNNAVLDNPTKAGYIFTGWCDTNDYTAATNTCSNRVGLVTTNNNNASKTMVRWTVPNDLSTDTTFIAMWEEDKFQVTTMNISANDYFGFALGAFGTFWVDWGDGNVEYITQTRCSSGCDAGATNWMGNATVYSHTYATSGVYTVRFGGLATGYKGGSFNDNTLYNSVSAINFGYRAYITGNSVNEGISVSFDYDTHVGKKIVGISGSLGALFPTISGYDTYNISTNLLFEVQPMFIDTFYGCNNLTGQIPAGLFSGVTGKALPYMFDGTFSGCSGLTGSIPATLFSGISGTPAEGMFEVTFYGCSGLTGSIPSGLFGNLSGTPAQYMFAYTFYGCSGLTGSIPSGLFGNLSGTPAQYMFAYTFYGCSGLTGSIPATLFSGISGAPAVEMFRETFYGCSGLTGSIPATLFSGITKPDPNNTAGTTATYQMLSVFGGTGLLTSCPSGMSQYITGFESYFDSRVSCMQTDMVLCSAGQTLVGTACATCPDPNDCPTAPTQYTCPNGYLADSAHAECRTAYTITYNLDGGVWPNNNTPASAYLPGVGYNLCDIPVKPGYFFNGWRDENNNWSYCIYISAQDTGNKTFYAQLALITQLCEAGQYLYIGAEYGAWCEPCLDGYYCPGGSDLSINNTGLYSCSSGSHPACECNIGDYYDYAQGTCKSCPTGHVWNSKEGACVCDKGNGYTCCDAGEYLEYVDKGGSGYYSCNKCDEGNYCEGGAWLESELNGSSVGQIPCAINTVAPDGNMSACISCGEHGYTNGTGESECICDTGYGWSAKTQSCVSTSCPTGRVWDSKEGACVCDKGNGYTCCDAGAYLYYESGKNDYYCDKCPSGSYCEGGAWTYNDLSGSSVGIETCPSGSTSDYNSSVCVCDSGTWDTTNHTCSGGSSAFTCESNTWLHVGNEQICTYATKTTDRALAIRVDANHVYYVMLTPASENDYPIHAGSNYKLKIREYNAAGTESTIYNAHDMSVVSE